MAWFGFLNTQGPVVFVRSLNLWTWFHFYNAISSSQHGSCRFFKSYLGLYFLTGLFPYFHRLRWFSNQFHSYFVLDWPLWHWHFSSLPVHLFLALYKAHESTNLYIPFTVIKSMHFTQELTQTGVILNVNFLKYNIFDGFVASEEIWSEL